MMVAPRENQTVVQAPFMDSPAFKAGIRPGDIDRESGRQELHRADHHASGRHAERRQGNHRFTFRSVAKAGTSRSK